MKYLVLPFFVLMAININAQEKWGLQQCIDYAMKNNISVKQADIQARVTALQLKQAQLNKYPTASFSTNGGLQFGRSIDPTTNQFTTEPLLYNQFQVQGGAQIYNWGKLRNTALAADFGLQAALVDIEKAANDVGLNVASYYLQILASKENINISEVQIAQTLAQYNNTKVKVEAGALPELNLAELESQLASDSSNYIAAKTAFVQNTLLLKALLNIDMAKPFEVETPPVDRIPLEPIASMQPEEVYLLAMGNQPLQKANELRIKGAEKNILASRASLYPSITGFYSLGSTYNNKSVSLVDSNTVEIPAYPIGDVTVGGTKYSVNSLPYQFQNYTLGKTHYFRQISDNFSQSIGIGISVPIFSNGNARLAVERSKLDLKNLELQQEQANQTLKSNVYTAYTNAIAALEKYNAGIKAVAASQKAYDYAAKRYEVGLLSTIDLITNQNNLLRAKLQQLNNQYDYVFKMKVLEFYKGQGLKL